MNKNHPIFHDVGVIALVPERWGGPWMPRHHVLTRLSKYFNVTWVSPPTYWRELFKRPHIFKAWEIDPEIADQGGFQYYNHKKWLPVFYKKHVLKEITDRIRIRRLENHIGKQGWEKTIVYIWRPEFEWALDLGKYDLSCYHIDDEYTFSDNECPLSRMEECLIKKVDQVFIHSPALLEKKGKANEKTIFLPNGVNYEAYSTPCHEPEAMKSIPHPRVGYVGLIKKQIDIPLLVTLGKNHPELSFVFVGPYGNISGVENLVGELEGMRNVSFLGGKPVDDLPGYLQHMDVCILCYDVTGYTKYIYPMKLHEYLASGRPVVGSPIVTLMEYSDSILLARTAEEWSLALREALSPEFSSPALVEKRKRLAKAHDWGRLVRMIAKTMYAGLGPGYSERFEKLSPAMDDGQGIGPYSLSAR